MKRFFKINIATLLLAVIPFVESIAKVTITIYENSSERLNMIVSEYPVIHHLEGGKMVIETGATSLTLNMADVVIKFDSDEIAPVEKGDVNGDGCMDIADVYCVLNVIFGKSESSEKSESGDNFYLDASDVNDDGKVDTVDAQWIMEQIAKKY